MQNDDLKNALTKGQKVKYNGAEYILTAIIYRVINGRLTVTAELLDKNGNSLVYAKASEIE